MIWNSFSLRENNLDQSLIPDTMNYRLLLLSGLAAALSACSGSPKVAPAIPQDKEIEAKVEKILKDMTLEEAKAKLEELQAKGEDPFEITKYTAVKDNIALFIFFTCSGVTVFECDLTVIDICANFSITSLLENPSSFANSLTLIFSKLI